MAHVKDGLSVAKNTSLMKSQLAKFFGEKHMQQPTNSKEKHWGYTT